MKFVANQFPRVEPGTTRLALVGEAPSLEEVSWRICSRGHGYAGQTWRFGSITDTPRCPSCGSESFTEAPTPFVGPSGRLLDDCIRRLGYSRDRCFIGNVSNIPRQVEDLNPGRLHADLRQLAEDLQEFQPNVVLVLGNTALRAFHPWHWRSAGSLLVDVPPQLALDDTPVAPKKKSSADDFALKIGDWRGSIFEGEIYGGGWSGKCVASYHPAAILRSGGPGGGPGANPEFLPLLRFDLKRAIAEAKSPDLDLPVRLPELPELGAGSAANLVRRLNEIRSARQPVGHDIEGTATSGVTDCSFATSPEHALWVPLRTIAGGSWWYPQEQQEIMEALRGLLEDPAVPKIMHNSSYEMFVWAWAHQIRLRGIGGDTMFAWHELMPELDKALNVAASIMTRQPNWKFGREGSTTEQERAHYNCTDSCVTLELLPLITHHFTPGQLAHYHFNVELLPAMVDQMLRGIRFDAPGRDQLVRDINHQIFAYQGELDSLAGIEAPTLAEVAGTVCYKKKLAEVLDWPDVITHAKPTWKTDL